MVGGEGVGGIVSILLKTLTIILSLFVWQTSFATDSTLFVILEKERFGYINSKGDIVIPPVFRFGGDFHNNVAIARLDGAYGFIDRKGKFVIPPIYDYAEDFVDNITIVTQGKNRFYINLRNEKVKIDSSGPCWWYSKSEGKKTIPVDAYFKEIDSLYNDSVFIIFLVNKKTKVAIQSRFNRTDWEGFVNGLLLVQLNNRLAYIDTTGKIIWQQKVSFIKEPHAFNLDFKPIIHEICVPILKDSLKPAPVFTDSTVWEPRFKLELGKGNSNFSDSLLGRKVTLSYQSYYKEDSVRIYETRICIDLQVENESGRWESLISNRSGTNLYSHNYTYWNLLPQNYWTFTLPIFEGYKKSRCQYITDIAGQWVKTEPFDCTYNPAQLINQHTSEQTRFIDTQLGRSKLFRVFNMCGFGLEYD